MLFTLISGSRRTRITGELLSWVSILYLYRYLSVLWWAEIFIYTVATRNSGTTIHLSLIYHSHTNQTDVFGCVGCLCTFQTSESVIFRRILHYRLASSGSSLTGSSWSSLRVKSPWLVSQVGNKLSWTAGGLLSAAITNPISWHAHHGCPGLTGARQSSGRCEHHAFPAPKSNQECSLSSWHKAASLRILYYYVDLLSWFTGQICITRTIIQAYRGLKPLTMLLKVCRDDFHQQTIMNGQ